MIPTVRPKITDHTMDQTVSQNVGQKRSPISTLTGRFEASDMPRSPVTAPFTKFANCSYMGLLRPSSSRTSSTVASSASGPAVRRAGSPGSRCTKRNTHTATKSSVGTMPITRFMKYRSISGHPCERPELFAPAAPLGSITSSDQFRRSRSRRQASRTCRRASCSCRSRSARSPRTPRAPRSR